jgi:hypothetical protein
MRTRFLTEAEMIYEKIRITGSEEDENGSFDLQVVPGADVQFHMHRLPAGRDKAMASQEWRGRADTSC